MTTLKTNMSTLKTNMSTLKTTLLTNVFNEEYLLPFWLQHHKDMFDDIIIIDYHSTDKSVEICKQICPNCKIITTHNAYFDAVKIDEEFMELERSIEGIKVVLNTTEFLFIEKPIAEYFTHLSGPISYAVNAISPYSKNNYYPSNQYEFMSNLLLDDVVYHYERGTRQIHTYPDGKYSVGRHSTYNPTTKIDNMYIIWFGYYPFNDALLARKLQIQTNIPDSDIKRGFGFHHLFSKEKLLAINQNQSATGKSLKDHNLGLYNLLYSKYKNKTFIVTGGCGFIGSHMVDKLINLGYTVIVIDNLLSGSLENLNKSSIFENVDITDFNALNTTIAKYRNIYGIIDGIFHFAAIARTPWCIDDPILCYKTNVLGTLNVLEAGRQNNVHRIVLSSSNVVYAFYTPYRTSKEALEGLAITYNKMYGMSVIALRYSNVYGKRQSECGPSPNVFAALRKSKKDLGKLIITGDGTQTRNYTHVSDIITGNLLAMFNDYCGVIDLCTGISIPLNEAAKYFNCPIEYVDERPGDIKHIIQSPDEAYHHLGWKATVQLHDGINDVL
jgi:UDP-glucose 4-epimerase